MGSEFEQKGTKITKGGEAAMRAVGAVIWVVGRAGSQAGVDDHAVSVGVFGGRCAQ